MKSKKVSVVTVCYNAVNSIEKTINSVLSQTLRNIIEFIVIDGGSNDGTLDVLKKYRGEIDVLVNEPDNGIYDAMNKGIDKSTGEWIFFLNSGDLFYSNTTISDLFNEKEYNGIAVLYGDICKLKKGGLVFFKADRPFFSPNSKLLSMGFSHQGTFVRTSFAKMHYFDLTFKCCADFNMIYSIWEDGGKFEYVPIPISIAEGRFGFSDRHRDIQRYEEAKILGIENTFKFKVVNWKENTKSLIKKYIK